MGRLSGGYCGRFAPTASGPLHLGSLLTALAGFLQARRAGGRWLLRIDDLDGPRCRPEHADTILEQLTAHGLHWDGAVRWQSRHIADYESALRQLQQRARLYTCGCSRATLARQSRAGPDGPVYAGTCRDRALTAAGAAFRLEAGAGVLHLADPWQPAIERNIERDIGDFVVRRADGQIGYQLACVVDEAAQAVTEVVRGADLIGSSLRQIVLMRRLAQSAPAYRHLPVLLDAEGNKLSKQNHAPPLDNAQAVANLLRCLALLGQAPPKALFDASVEELLGWSVEHWNSDALPRVRALSAPV